MIHPENPTPPLQAILLFICIKSNEVYLRFERYRITTLCWYVRWTSQAVKHGCFAPHVGLVSPPSPAAELVSKAVLPSLWKVELSHRYTAPARMTNVW